MNKWFKVGLITVLTLWAVSTFISLPRTNAALTKLGTNALQNPANEGKFAQAKVKFGGQEAYLDGVVATAADKQEAESIISENLRTPGGVSGKFNPVLKVHNNLKVDPSIAPKPEPAPTASTKPAEDMAAVPIVTPPPAPTPPPTIVKPKPPAPPAEPAKPVAPTPPREAYIGWTSAEKTISLFGRVPEESIKQKVLADAKTHFPDTTISGDAIRLDDKSTLLPGSSISFDIKDEDTSGEPRIAFAIFGSSPRFYPLNAFNSEIQNDFKRAGLSLADIGKDLAAFRSQQITSGKLELEEPFLNLLHQKGEITLAGEVSSAEEKTQITEAAQKAYPDSKIIDQITVSNLVHPRQDLQATLESFPEWKDDADGSAIAPVGGKWRSEILHAIYYRTGSDRSIDQERALNQIRRILRIKPDATFAIVGHTDNTGNKADNEKLSLERAHNVLTYLTNAGIKAEILSTRGAGQSEPIADNKSESGRALNRRVDIVVQP